MLSLSQKESILLKRGVAIPRFPVRRLPRSYNFDELQALYPGDGRTEDLELNVAVVHWQESVEVLYQTHIRGPVDSAIQTIKSKAKFASADISAGPFGHRE